MILGKGLEMLKLMSIKMVFSVRVKMRSFVVISMIVTSQMDLRVGLLVLMQIRGLMYSLLVEMHRLY